MRGNVADLRREMNSLRKQLDDARCMESMQPVASQYQTITSPTLRSAALRPEAEEAIAEEIKGDVGEELNLLKVNKQMIIKALEMSRGNRKKAAATLGISDRTLYRKIRQYGLDGKNDDETM